MLQAPSLRDIYDARRAMAPYLLRTPLFNYPALDQVVGTRVYVKHENYQPIGAFKVRGGINLISRLSPQERRQGVITASTGNHGQSIAYAGRLFDVPVVVAVPEGANVSKVGSMRALGAEVVFHGADFDAAGQYALHLAEERGMRYVHAANEPLLIAGVATLALEIMEELPQVGVIIVPMGGGSLASCCCIVAQAVSPHTRVVAVQSEAAPAAYLSWKEGRLAKADMRTSAEGLATGVGFELPQSIIRERLDEFVLVSDRQMLEAVLLYLELVRSLVEPAGAASLAAALQIKERLAGQTVVLVASGGNISMAQLKEVLALG
jgi:threonine dehydratase